MNNVEHPSSADDLAVSVINASVQEAETEKGAYSNIQFSGVVQRRAEEMGVQDHQGIVAYVGALRNSSHSFVITTLDDGVGGLYDGQRIKMATATIAVSADIDKTVAQLGEVLLHEQYHQQHEHTEPMMTIDGADNIIIAGERFTTTAFIEGLTVAQTGNQYVSLEYLTYERNLLAAAARAALSVSNLEHAVAVRDLTSIDDRLRDPEGSLTISP